jgi:hypothetical protein
MGVITGWQFTQTGTNMSGSVLVPICDDGLIVGTETCDDNITLPDEWGCKSNCIGNWDGWDCTDTLGFP